MKYFLAIIPALLILASCNNSAPPVANSEKPINVREQSNEARTVLAHSAESGTPKPVVADNSGGQRAGGGDPIDTSKFDSAIATAEKNVKAKSDDESKRALADAYFERGVALTEARQYASALGDYRRALKLDPDHAESKKWIEQIVGIYKMLKKDAPKEGSEPPPLPFKKVA